MRTIANAENDAALGGEKLPRLDAPEVRRLKLSRRSALFATEKYAGLSGSLGLLLVLLLWCRSLSSAEKSFVISGVTISLEEVSSDVGVTYRSMRFNRAAQIWNLEVILTNKSTRTFN